MTLSTTQPLHIEAVSTAHQLEAFIRLPERLYAADPQWITPLRLEQRQRLSKKNPFLADTTWQLWLARRGDRIVGRISAQINAQHQQRYADGLGYFGLLDAEDDPDVFRALLQTAEQWLQQRGMHKLCGPFNLSINQEIGLLVDGFTTPPFIMMGHAPPYARTHVEACAYHKAMDLLAYRVQSDFPIPPVMAKLLHKTAQQITLRCFDKRHAQRDLALLRHLFNDAWADNWGFVPFSEAEFNHLGHTLLQWVDADLIQIALVEGQPVAFIVVMPNINEAIRDLHGGLLPWGWLKLLWRLKVRFPRTVRIPLMGVKKAYQHTRLGPALAFSVINAVRQPVIRRGVRCVEMGWILETNHAMRHIIEAVGGEAYKRYRMYEKNCSDSPCS